MNSTIILSVFFVALCFAAICVKILIQKNGQFSGTCASNNPLLNKDGEKCSYCGQTQETYAKKEEKPSEK